MPGGSYQLRFLHISDLHARGLGEAERWRRRLVLGKAWERNLDTILEDEGPLDFVFFSGDAANSGQPDQFEETSEFLADLRDRLGLPAGRLFTVPGNHDIDRKLAAPVWERLRMATGASHDLLGVSRWMNEFGREPFGFEKTWREAILERQSAYRAWAKAPAGLGYRTEITLAGWPFPIQILGLDTSWLCGDNADAGHLLLTENQLMRHATQANGEELPGLRLALMHHPLHELADGADCRKLMAGHVDLVLRGHLHSTEAVEWIDPDRNLRELAAGSLYEGDLGDNYVNSCHYVRLELDSTGRPLEAMLRFRSFSPRGKHWFDDDGLYRESKAGRLRWKFRGAGKPAETNPYSPWEPKPEQCFGRNDLFQRLEAALEERRSMWLVGDSRIGKSLVLLAWEKRLKEAGRVVKLVSGQTAAGIDAGEFVQSVTALTSPRDADGAANRLETWIQAVGKPGLPPVILVDEVEKIVETCDERFFDRLRGMLGSVCLVFSSKDVPDAVFNKNNKTSPLTNRMEMAWVGLLEPAGAEQVVGLGSRVLGPGDADLMRRWCGRHPFFLQLLGYKLAQARRQGADIDEALAEIHAEARSHLSKIWDPVPESQKQAVRDAARGVPATAAELKLRGLVTDDGLPFAEILRDWIAGR